MLDAELRRLIETDNFASHLGVELVLVEEGHSIARMNLDDRHLNFLGTVHGGAIFGLADVAFGAAANSHGNKCMAFHISIEFLGPHGDTPYLEAEVRAAGRAGRALHYEMEVHNSSGERVAILDGWAYSTRHSLTE